MIDKINEKFGTEFTNIDKVLEQIVSDMDANEELRIQARNNSQEHFRFPFNDAFMDVVIGRISQSIRNVQMAEKDQNRTFAQRTQAQYDKGRQQPERSEYNERNHLQQTGGLSYENDAALAEQHKPQGEDILRRDFKERCCVCIKPTNILISYITSWFLVSVQNSTPIPITLYNFWESNSATNIRQSQRQYQSRLPASILNVQFYFLYAM